MPLVSVTSHGTCHNGGNYKRPPQGTLPQSSLGRGREWAPPTLSPLHAMTRAMILALLLQSLIHYPLPMGDGLDEVTRERMELREHYLQREMSRMQQELEQGPLERALRAGGALLWAALQQCHFWAPAAALGLLLALWFSRRIAAMNQRAAARRALEEARRRRRASLQTMLTIRKRYKEVKEIWAFAKEMKNKVTRAMQTRKRKKSMVWTGGPLRVDQEGLPAAAAGTLAAHELWPGEEAP
ncbi:uncharacterized protein LOC127475980 [Manacus candei]|uniref:uncharacterized protein LOC127475980 n=1 Tax=Manacus candei TaxID=415023 RepID=UPI002226DA68|nr:uncharacterized protein LOC127475980 [Manacus candei]XP_051654224.1 uncharacterized protein LOC127475980 [Manacus candei]XP_051654225.1 uncharacterized protein LOC127475980 [Manacus candei]